ncbi:hypothetical protein [Streptomyces hygroscopicus]|uniref:hypothetical protein n=1 Tax=Streptomyces hygroscopicus TaxID=1912 RepID=UPI001FCB2ABB|nr:hypothetical protein [Streptomyces hygroscopicus]BDH10491.1 hypothetical protein HOK021_16700 [Streptomyces hygroscopicus]
MTELSEKTKQQLWHLRQPVKLDESTELRPLYYPALRYFSVQLWKGGALAGLLGEVGQYTHPDDVLDDVDGFLVERGERPLGDDQLAHLGGGLIVAKGGPDLTMLAHALEHPETFRIL